MNHTKRLQTNANEGIESDNTTLFEFQHIYIDNRARRIAGKAG